MSTSKRKATDAADGHANTKARVSGFKDAPPWSGADVRHQLLHKKYVYGTCVTSTSPTMPDAIIKSGVGVVFIDTEHVPIVRDTLSWMCQLFDARGVPALVRVPEPEPYRVTEYLDLGARGIIAPYIETVDQAKMLVGATKLRPLKGEKLKFILDRLTPIDPSALDDNGDVRTNEILYAQVEKILRDAGDEAPEKTVGFMKEKNGNNFLLLNIESQGALDRLEELASIPGVDGFQIGPMDLSCNLGVPKEWTSEVFLGAVSRIIEVAEKYHIGCGNHYSFTKQLEYQAMWGKAGNRLVMHSMDTKLVAEKLKSDLSAIAAQNGDPEPPDFAKGVVRAV